MHSNLEKITSVFPIISKNTHIYVITLLARFGFVRFCPIHETNIAASQNQFSIEQGQKPNTLKEIKRFEDTKVNINN